MPIILTIILFVISIGIPIYSAIAKVKLLKKDEKAEMEFEKSLEETFSDDEQ